MRTLYLAASLFIVLSCSFFKSDGYKRPLMNRTERELYIVNYAWDMTTEHKLAFIDGKIVPGMKAEHVLQIYGEPDLSVACPKNQNVCDRVWQYGTNDTEIVGSVLIKDTIVIKVTKQLSLPCKF